MAVEKKIAAGQTHTYGISLQEDQYVRLVVDQKGIDLGVRVSDEDGRRIGDFDTPNAAGGPESIVFISERSGTYRIELQPLDEFRNPAPGQYEIRVVELRKASDQELRTGRALLTLRTKGVILLNEVLLELPGVRNRLMRAGYESEVAGMLWSFDEKSAAKLLTQAADVVRESLPSNGSFSSEAFQGPIQLRRTIARQMMKHDPEMALAFIRSTRSPMLERYLGNQEKELELSISKALAQQNPKAAFQIAKESLKNGLSQSILDTVEALRDKNPELAANIAHDILAGLADQPLIEIPSNAYMASGLIQLVRSTGSPSAGARKPEVNLISDTELRSLLQKMASEVLSFTPPDTGVYSFQKFTAEHLITTLKEAGGSMHIVTPELLASLEQRLGATPGVKTTPPEGGLVSQVHYLNLEEALNVSHRQAILNGIKERSFEDVLQHLEKLSPDDRSNLVGIVAGEIGPGLKKSTALALLDRARKLLPYSPRAQDEDEVENLLAFVESYSLLDPNRGFEIVEPLIDQFNDLSIAALTMNGFSEIYYQDGDLITTGENAVAVMAIQLAKAVGQLAQANFQRAKSDADRVRPLSVRIKMHLAIASNAISGQDNDDEEDD